jgi:hypothetical protein
VEKYELPSLTYESLPNSVLAWKKTQHLGRFDPKARSPEDLMREQAKKDAEEVEKRGKLLLSGFFFSFLFFSFYIIVFSSSV